VIDPLYDFMPEHAEINSVTDMARFLASLEALARKFHCAVLVLRHLRKSKDGAAGEWGIGSVGIGGRARSELFAVEEPGTERKLVVHGKTNWGVRGRSFAYRFKEESGVQQVEWAGDSDITYDDLALLDASPRGRPPREIEAAEEFLKAQLAQGPKSSSSVLAAAEANAFSESTRKRAYRNLGIRHKRDGRETVWYLPEAGDAEQ